MQLNKPRLRGKRKGRIESYANEETSSITTTRRKGNTSSKARKTAAAAAVLVASFLVINSPGSAQAAPSPLHSESLRIRQISERGSRPIAESAYHQRSDNADRDGNRLNLLRRTSDVNWGAINEKSDHLLFVAPDNPILSPLQDIKQRQGDSIEATPSLLKRGDAYNASTRTFNVPASFTSNLANAWDPGSRSVWFQRKAVIITSIFLAIFIVLIIGCTVFLRDKRDDEMEEEYDVSDEAALQRMRDEREMRLGSRGEKKSKRRKKKDDQSSNKEGGDGATTAIVASRWARLPTRKIRLRKKKSTGSSSGQNDDNRASLDRENDANRTSTSLTGADTQNSNPASVSSQHVSPTTHSSDGQIPNEPPPLLPTIGEDGAAPATSSIAGTSSPGSNQNAGRTRLNAADLDYAEEEEERMLLSDALPPAYISSQNRGPGGSNAGPSSSNVLHPSANRQLAGQSEEALVAARGDSKRPMHAEHEEMVGNSDLQMSVDNEASTGVSTSSLGLEGHIATDDKNVLSRMREAASRPDSSPHYVPSAPGGSSLGNANASAPVFNEEEEINQQLALSTGALESQISSTIQQAEGSSVLPAPPAPHIQSSFSHFDLPYSAHHELQNVQSSTSAGPSRASEKAKEAAEEERQTAALLASRPDDARMLPQYEPAGSSLQPSAPDWDDGGDIGASVPSAPSAPSAPPPPPEEDVHEV